MWVLAGLSCFGVALVAHAGACRIPLRANIVLMFVAIAAAMGVVLATAVVRVYGITIELCASLLFYALACEAYTFMFTFVSTSVAASVLMRLRECGLTRDEIEQHYNASYMVDARFDKLVRNGFLRSENGTFVLTRPGVRVLTVFDRLRWFFVHASASQTHEESPSRACKHTDVRIEVG